MTHHHIGPVYVSSDTFRRSSKLFCSQLGKNNTRSVFSFSPNRRSRVRFYDKPPILFQHFCCPKENRRLETNYKSKTSEQISKETAFQDGLSKQSQKSGTTRRFGNFSGFSRCLPTYINLNKATKFLRFCIQEKPFKFTFICFGTTYAPRVFTKNGVVNYSTPQIAKMSI